MSLTNTALKYLSVTGKTYERADRDGLSVRVSPVGKVTFQYRYRFHGKPRRMKLGAYPDVSLKLARDLLAQARVLLEQGIDPIQQAHAEKARHDAAFTTAMLCEKWMDEYAKIHRKRWQELEQMLGKNVIPQVGHIQLENVTRRMIAELVLSPIVKRGSPIQANKVLTALKQVFNFGVTHGLLDDNPCALIDKRNVGGREVARDRVLSDQEIRLIWCNLDEASMSGPIKIAIKLLLATGQRRGELTRARWEDVDLSKRCWNIPAENSKNGKAHRIPLSFLATELFAELRELSWGSNWVLPSFKLDDAPLSERAISRAVKRWQSGESASPKELWIKPFTPHDLRRTAATKMNELGVPPHVVEKVLNHTMGGVMAVYNRYEYEAECVEALKTWGNALRLLVDAPNNVVLLKPNQNR